MEEKRSSFTSSLGFILAAAGSAVGLGNIWRFPYLAAKNGGGLFIVVYVVLALTFGFTLLVTELAIGRKTKQSSLTAYGLIDNRFNWLGTTSAIVPFLILPYYCIIGGWVLKYAATYITGHGLDAADDNYFFDFIMGTGSSSPVIGALFPIVFDVIFLVLTAAVVYQGVNKGIETMSKVLMPVLFILVIGISIFSLTIKNPETGKTGLDGLKVYLIPNLDGIGLKEFMHVVMDAMGQLFYSISVAMGIMVTYGSYVKDEDNLMSSVNQIEIFDTLIALLAGVMIIPAVVVFMGEDAMSKGPGLIFIALPKIFEAMGLPGMIIGAVFFVMVLFAALTSSVSVLEAVVAGLIDKFGISRKKATVIETVVALVIGVFICLGYNVFMFNVKLPNGADAQLLDIVDYLTNNIFMPVVAIGSCLLIGWVVKPLTVTDEITKNGEKMYRKGLYNVMVTVVAPILLTILLLESLGFIK